MTVRVLSPSCASMRRRARPCASIRVHAVQCAPMRLLVGPPGLTWHLYRLQLPASNANCMQQRTLLPDDNNMLCETLPLSAIWACSHLCWHLFLSEMH